MRHLGYEDSPKIDPAVTRVSAWRPWMRDVHQLMPLVTEEAPPGSATSKRPVRRLAVMFAIAQAEVVALEAEIGPGWTVVDGRSVDRAAVVLMLPCSEQTTSAVRTSSPTPG